MVFTNRISLCKARICRTASTISPVPASPLVRIIADPSLMRRNASPKLRHPDTKGVLKLRFSMWFSSSAMVKTSDSSMDLLYYLELNSIYYYYTYLS